MSKSKLATFKIEDTGFAEFAVYEYPADGSQKIYHYKSASQDQARGVLEFLRCQQTQRDLGIKTPPVATPGLIAIKLNAGLDRKVSWPSRLPRVRHHAA